jgi:Protein of unknown function (DUF429)
VVTSLSCGGGVVVAGVGVDAVAGVALEFVMMRNRVVDRESLPVKHNAVMSTNIVGVDFTSRPTQRKPITVAHGVWAGAVVQLKSLQRHTSFESFSDWLANDEGWVGAFDMPFGLPRELVQTLQWPAQWLPLTQHYCGLTREDIRDTFKAFCDARPVGGKFAHRATDKPAGSSPSMKWVNPPVAYMLHAGMPLLLKANIHIPVLHESRSIKAALEGYPALVSREIVGHRSYKSDDKAKQTPERLIARKDILTALEAGRSRLGLRLKLTPTQASQLADDASGDLLDAVLCLMQAGWAASRHAAGNERYGLPKNVDALEGWIITADLFAADVLHS